MVFIIVKYPYNTIRFFIAPVSKALNVQPLKAYDWLVIIVSATVSLLAIQLLKRTKIIHDEN